MSSSEPDEDERSQEEATGEVADEEHMPSMVVPSMTDSAVTLDVSGASSDAAVASGHPSGKGPFVSSDDSFLKAAVSGIRIHEWNSGLKLRPLVASGVSLALMVPAGGRASAFSVRANLWWKFRQRRCKGVISTPYVVLRNL